MKKAVLSTLAAEAFKDRSRIITRVHSHFEHGFNVEWGNGLLYVSQGPYIAALGLILEGFDDINLVEDGNRIKFELQEDTLTVQPYLRDHQKKEVYHVTQIDLSVPHLAPLSHKQIDILKSFQPEYFWPDTGFHRLPALQALYEAYVESPAWAPQILQKFVGAGIGLTPSGDDFIMGIMLLKQALSLDMDISVDTQSTTAVSQSYYYALRRGQVALPWIHVLKALQAEDKEAYKKAIHIVQRVGSTSGNDTLLGVHALLRKVYNISEG